MKHKHVLNMTTVQFLAMIDLANTIEAIMGTGDYFDKEQKRNLLFFDRMLKSNGYKRK